MGTQAPRRPRAAGDQPRLDTLDSADPQYERPFIGLTAPEMKCRTLSRLSRMKESHCRQRPASRARFDGRGHQVSHAAAAPLSCTLSGSLLPVGIGTPQPRRHTVHLVPIGVERLCGTRSARRRAGAPRAWHARHPRGRGRTHPSQLRRVVRRVTLQPASVARLRHLGVGCLRSDPTS